MKLQKRKFSVLGEGGSPARKLNWKNLTRTTIDNFLPVHLLLPDKSAAKPLREKKKRVDTATEPKIRLWKVTSQAVYPKLGKVELLILALFLMIAASAMVVSVQGLSCLMDSNALEQQIAAKSLGGSEQAWGGSNQ